MIKWKKFFNNIPAQVKVGKSLYQILWTDEFPKDHKQVGETHLNETKQIIIKNGQSDKEAVHTYFHEFLHACSEEYNVNLTENQVLALEKSLKDWLENGNLFRKENKQNARNKRKRHNLKRIR